MLAFVLAVILSLNADFVQTKQIKLMREPQVSTGHLVYRAPDYMQWQYIKPNKVTWEMNGEQTNVNPQLQRMLKMIMASISGEAQNDAKLQREMKKMFREVNITMDDTGEVAKRVELVEQNGDITVIEFSNVIKQ
ncbi:MAG: outer membrane lipoprotein carrier protein LolA [Paludibacteraceae bacterium]|nr:outer membrane lipoprotein carrier protein LolA [Paludibacteraceae bacterium]MBQ4390670.1 outer membrane lipoprotein carrier protein LolA [Paludibacteraceae bacterium]